MNESVSDNYQQHIKQNNDRLALIRQTLSSDPSSFRGVCRELIEWCNDDRAFSQCFHQQLIFTLAEVVRLSYQPGYDRCSASKLISVCHKHRHLLTNRHSASIDEWNRSLSMDPVDSAAQTSNWQQQRQPSAIVPNGTAVSVMTTVSYDTVGYDYMHKSARYTAGRLDQEPGYGSDPTVPRYERSAVATAVATATATATATAYAYDRNAPYIYPHNGYMQDRTTHRAQSYLINEQPNRMPYANYSGRAALPSPVRHINPYPSNRLMLNASRMQQPYGMMYRAPSYAYPPGSDEIPKFTLRFNMSFLKPFGLEHNATINSVEFCIPPDIFQNYLTQAEFEVQLKCFHREDKRMENSWPQTPTMNAISVQVHVNGELIPIRSPNRSLFVKNFCRPGKNILQITVNQCVCSHYFLMQMAKRIPVRKIVEQMLYNPQNSFAAAKERVHFFFLNNQQSQIQSTCIRLPLLCPLKMQKIGIPARGRMCRHLNCFDLEAFLICNQEKTIIECPSCKAPLDLTSIEVDHFLFSILQRTRDYPATNEILVDAEANWRPADPNMNMPMNNSLKRDLDQSGASNNSSSAPPLKRFKSENLSTNNKQETQNPLSVPPVSYWGSPTGGPPSVLSPYSVSTTAQLSSSSPASVPPSKTGPSSAPQYGGPGTPVTPGTTQNPSSVPNGTSPSGSAHMTIQSQNSSIDTQSLTGSAPYTPASVGSSAIHSNEALASSTNPAGIQSENDQLVLDDFLFDTAPSQIFSDADLTRYLSDEFIPPSDKSSTTEEATNHNTDGWSTEDVLSLLSAEI